MYDMYFTRETFNLSVKDFPSTNHLSIILALTRNSYVLHDESREDDVKTDSAVKEKPAAESVRFDQILHENRNEKVRPGHAYAVGDLKDRNEKVRPGRAYAVGDLGGRKNGEDE